MITFSAPSTTMGKSLNNNIGKAFQEDKANRFVSWDSEGITNLAFRCDRVSLPGRIIVTSPYKEANYGLSREYPTNEPAPAPLPGPPGILFVFAHLM